MVWNFVYTDTIGQILINLIPFRVGWRLTSSGDSIGTISEIQKMPFPIINFVACKFYLMSKAERSSEKC